MIEPQNKNKTKQKSNEKCIGALSKYNISEANQK